MERAQWLKHMRENAEALYDHIAPEYWVNYGLYENDTHCRYLGKFLERVGKGGTILSAACGAGRYDGILLESGHSVLGIDQSQRMLARAKERFPAARYEKMGLQEMDFHEAFEGAICMDAMEHISPEDWPGIMNCFAAALKPGGVLYFTVEVPDTEMVEASYERAKSMGLPVVLGEVADAAQASYDQVDALEPSGVPGEAAGPAVYHYYPSVEQVQAWTTQAGLEIEDEGMGSGYYHFVARKPD